MKINSIIDLVKDLDTSRQTKNLNKLLIRILLHLQVEFSKLENGYSANVYDMEVIIAIALQMDTYQALLFRQWFISKVVNRKDCQAEQVKHEYPMIIVMNGTMPRGAS